MKDLNAYILKLRMHLLFSFFFLPNISMTQYSLTQLQKPGKY